MPKEINNLWFVTFVTHNTRISERMITYGIQLGEPFAFTLDEQVFIVNLIFDVCQRNNIQVLAANILPDHIHMVIVAPDEKSLSENIRKIKGYTSYTYLRSKNYEKGYQIWAQKFNRQPISDEVALSSIMEYVRFNHQKHAERWGESQIKLWENQLRPIFEQRCVSLEDIFPQNTPDKNSPSSSLEDRF